MMLTELTPVLGSSLPVQELKDHLRLGTGFSDDGMQNGLVESYLRAAMAGIEGRIGKVLLARRFLWVLEDWRDLAGQALPVAPVTGVVSVSLVTSAGGITVLDPAQYRLVPDTHRPRLAAAGVLLPVVPVDGRAEVVFDAGFGPWSAVPADLAQAVLMLAAEFYDQRHEVAAGVGLPFAVQALIERWRNVRVLGGGAA